jgi:Cu2+-exporting ATPase
LNRLTTIKDTFELRRRSVHLKDEADLHGSVQAFGQSYGFQVIHIIPGRIRLRLPALKQNPAAIALLCHRLEELDGITRIRTNRAAQSLVICYHPGLTSDVQLIHALGHCVQGLFPTPTYCSLSTVPPVAPVLEEASPLTPLAVLPKDIWKNLRLPVLAATLGGLSQFSRLSALRHLARLVFLVAAFPVAQRAAQSVIQQRRLNIDCLDFLALSLSAGQGKIVTPAMVIVLHELGDAIREQTARSTEIRTADLMDAIGRVAWVKRDPNQPPQQIPSDRVQVGDTVVVYPGEQIPVDGTVLQGDAIIDQQGLTGEAMPVVRQIGASVMASTLVRSGKLEIRAERVASQTRAAKSIELLKKAPVHDTRMANYAEAIADRLILPSLLLATLVLMITRDPARAAAILTIDFVTGIRVSMPTAFLGALNHTTRHGILVRSGRTLEQLAEVDTVVFDKTGTLTEGSIVISHLYPVNGMSDVRLLQLAAAAEQRITHPVAEAIVQCAHERGVTIPARGNWSYTVGLGITAEVDGQEVWVGSSRFLQQAGITWDTQSWNQETWVSESQSLIYVACDRQFQGVLQYTDPLRTESDRLIQALQDQYDVEVFLLTGDEPGRASQVAQTLGIPPKQVYAQAFPDEKARIVRELHQAGRTVAFVGDGLNDSVALAYADVSISFAHGSDIARETADVVLMDNDLMDLLEAIAISRQTRNLIDQNIALVIAPNLMALGLATTVGLNPLIATAIHNGSAIAAGINSLRPLVEHQFDQEQSSTLEI